MAQLELKEQLVTLKHIAFPSNSKENDESSIAVHLKFELQDSSGWLSSFHPRMRSAFYMADDTEAALPGLDGQLTKRVFGDQISGFNLKSKLEGATGRIDHGVKSYIDIELATVNGVSVSLLEGGAIKAIFVVQARFPSKSIKTLTELMGAEVKLTLAMSQSEIEGLDQD